MVKAYELMSLHMVVAYRVVPISVGQYPRCRKRVTHGVRREWARDPPNRKFGEREFARGAGIDHLMLISYTSDG